MYAILKYIKQPVLQSVDKILLLILLNILYSHKEYCT